MVTQKRSQWLDRIGSFFALLLFAGILVGWLRLGAALTAFYLFALGGIGAALVSGAFFVRRLRGHPLGAPGLATVAAGLAFILAVLTSSGDGPPINDFTTDLQEPPSFAHARTLPANLGRDMEYPEEYAAQQTECCGDLAPQTFSTQSSETFAAAAAIAEAEPQWTVVLVNPENGTIEATASTLIFGFQDDIVVRVRPSDSGSIVDIRSKSRDGKSDLGANAARIRSFQNKLSDQIR